MADIKFPNFKNKSEQYLFKRKLPIKRQSKIKLFRESFLMISLALFILLLNYFIPSKDKLFISFILNIKKIILKLIELFDYFFDIFLVFFIIFSTIWAVILIVGAAYRLGKLIRSKPQKFDNKYKPK
tara:strand:+ start:666 stop:1046 length:381 start_codon:yes stop_codon:yes gene_type:complete